MCLYPAGYKSLDASGTQLAPAKYW